MLIDLVIPSGFGGRLACVTERNGRLGDQIGSLARLPHRRVEVLPVEASEGRPALLDRGAEMIRPLPILVDCRCKLRWNAGCPSGAINGHEPIFKATLSTAKCEDVPAAPLTHRGDTVGFAGGSGELWLDRLIEVGVFVANGPDLRSLGRERKPKRRTTVAD